MKLIRASSVIQKVVKVPVRQLTGWERLQNFFVPDHNVVPTSLELGRRVVTNCFIDFEGSPVALGHIIDELKFDTQIYCGVTPISYEYKTNVYECVVCMLKEA